MQKQRATIFGVRIEQYDGSDDEHVVGFHECTYRDNGKFHPVLPIGRRNTMANIANTKFVFVDLPRAMTSDDAFAFACNHARLAKYRDAMVAAWNGNNARDDKRALLERIAQLESQLAKRGNVENVTTDENVENDDETMSDDERELRELGVA